MRFLVTHDKGSHVAEGESSAVVINAHRGKHAWFSVSQIVEANLAKVVSEPKPAAPSAPCAPLDVQEQAAAPAVEASTPEPQPQQNTAPSRRKKGR